MKYWNKTINLLIKANNFYKLTKKNGLLSKAQAVNEFGGWSSEDDSPDSESPESKSPTSEIPESVGKPGEDLGMFHNLKKLANTIDNKNPDVANQIEIIAELIKKAIRNNRGYSYIMNALNNFVSETLPDNYPDDEDDEEDDVDESKLNAIQREVRRAKQERLEIEMMMNKAASDIRKRALNANVDIRKPDPPEVTKEMRLAKLDFEGVLEQKERNLHDRRETGFIDPNEKQTAKELKYMGVDIEDSSSEASDIENELGFSSEIDKSDIAGKREREGGGLPGMGVRTAHNYKDYIDFYNEEIKKYTDDLSDTQNEKSRNNLIELINILELLKASRTKLEDLSKNISWTTYPATAISPAQKIIDQPELKEDYNNIKNELRVLGRKRTILLQKIKSIKLDKISKNLEKRYNTSRSEKEKFLIKQLILLNDLRSSPDLNKGPEIEARKQLINELKGAASLEEIEDYPARLVNIDPVRINLLLEKIKEASLLKMNRKQYNLKQVLKNRELLQAGKQGDISGLILKLRHNIASNKADKKSQFYLDESRSIISNTEAEELTTYKVYIDAIAKAKQTGNKKEEKFAISNLAAALTNVQYKLDMLNEKIKLFEDAYNDVIIWRKALELADKKNLFKKENISNEEYNELSTLLNTGQLLLSDKDISRATALLMDNICNILSNKLNELKRRVKVEVTSTETGEVTVEDMSEEEAKTESPFLKKKILRNNMRRRKNILLKIADESFKNKMITDVVNDSELNSVLDEKEYAHKVFQKMIESLKNNNNIE